MTFSNNHIQEIMDFFGELQLANQKDRKKIFPKGKDVKSLSQAKYLIKKSKG